MWWKLLAALEIFGIAYALWCLYVFVLVGTLTEIKKSSWHFRVSNMMLEYPREPKDSCQYRKWLILTPVYIIGVGIFFLILMIVWACTFIAHWTIWPFFFGKKPTAGFTKNYFLEWLEDGPETNMDYFTTIPPFLYCFLVACCVGLYYLYRLISGGAGTVEVYITSTIALLAVTIASMIWITRRPSLKLL